MTDFLQNTCVPYIEIEDYPNYKQNQTTPFIEKSFKPMSPFEKAQRIQSGEFDPSQAPSTLNLHSSQVPQPSHALSE